MDSFQAHPTPMGWELTELKSGQTVLRTLTKDEMLNELDHFMAGRTATVEVLNRSGAVEETRPYPGSHHQL
ncbi:hypothetical protein MST27_12430 [Pseudomonas sp. PS1]|uniref:Uncharacterized protein n=1 Tax=Stutzerimonas marianensis TaxID=2929513 RepID=A0A9X1W360_9GAMM|nr:hypothetical protein [Pseudomonas marianensis]MCJ0974176.1 hypothetical protein [Pseudomonas marianensis]